MRGFGFLLAASLYFCQLNLAHTQSPQKEFSYAHADTTNTKVRVKLVSAGHGNTIVTLPLELYLKGVLPSEMPASWPLEALKAQAVAARSYVLATLRERRRARYDVENTVRHQVFNWENYSLARSGSKTKVDRAVDETRGQYIVDHMGLPYKTFFHADCGGRTEEPGDVWAGAKPNGTTRDRHCALRAKSEWRTSVLVTELNELVRNYLIKAKDKSNDSAATSAERERVNQDIKIVSISAANYTGSGRVRDIEIEYVTDGSEVVEKVEDAQMRPVQSANSEQSTLPAQKFLLTAQSLREIIGFDRLKSTQFSVTHDGSHFVFDGRGHGHGAGLCQRGARAMAQNGQVYTDILRHYYPSTVLYRGLSVIAQASKVN